MSIPTLDKCPGYNLYIGGFIGLRRPQALKSANITHIVSVLDWKFEDETPLLRGYQHLHIPVDDVEDENLLEWFPRSNAFIHRGLEYWKSRTSDLPRDGTIESNDGRGNGVYIHCAMGKSRSATILLAYLLWSSRQRKPSNTSPQSSPEDSDMVPLPTRPLTVIKALELLRQGRPIAEPNEGFMDQLHMYEDMGCPTSDVELKKHKIYRRWLNKRSVEESLRVNMAPEMATIKFEDESEPGDETEDDTDDTDTAKQSAEQRNDKETRSQGSIKGKPVTTVAPGIKAPDGTSSSPPASQPQVTVKCRKCRHVLATTPFILSHVPPPHADPAFYQQQQRQQQQDSREQEQRGSQDPSPDREKTHRIESQVIGSPSSRCAHVFLHPLSWMRPVLAEGQMEGRLTCPKCSTNIGKFAWSGLRCSCGGWVTPGFAVTRAKVDEVTVSSARGSVAGSGGGTGSGSGGGSALRLPPGMRRGGGNL